MCAKELIALLGVGAFGAKAVRDLQSNIITGPSPQFSARITGVFACLDHPETKFNPELRIPAVCLLPVLIS